MSQSIKIRLIEFGCLAVSLFKLNQHVQVQAINSQVLVRVFWGVLAKRLCKLVTALRMSASEKVGNAARQGLAAALCCSQLVLWVSLVDLVAVIVYKQASTGLIVLLAFSG